MANPLLKAVLKTGKQVTVYKHRDGGYVDFTNCSTKYQAHEITIIGKQEN